MKISHIHVSNYRLLKKFELSLENDLSLIIGKNNSGKTSLLSVMERFLLGDASSFAFEDLNLNVQREIKESFVEDNFAEDYVVGLNLKIYIQYGEGDNLGNISRFMLNLNPSENYVVLSFSYRMKYEDVVKLKVDYEAFHAASEVNKKKDIIHYLKKYHRKYFNVSREALEYKNEENALEISDRTEIVKVLNFKRIKAKRAVNNSDGTQNKSDTTLSKLSSDYYSKESDLSDQNESINELRDTLSQADEKFTEAYAKVFKNVITSVKRFGGVKSDDSVIEIISSLQEDRVLRDNTSVVYKQNDHILPEDYNGLGYMNLIAMIFEIEVVLNDFKKKYSDRESPADINLFFIEEPEAHTHPQMQYVFINNIKELLSEAKSGKGDGVAINLQTLLSTHSSHITSASNFDDIKYFLRENDTSVIARNLTSLKEEYAGDPKQYQFLKQYLTLTKAELFFADKAVLIEGDTERILIPTIMKKLDVEDSDKAASPLLTQNISIVEVGAYSQIFEKFIDFLGIKTLIITDLDSVDDAGGACPVVEGRDTSNDALKFFFAGKSLNEFKALAISAKALTKKKGKWVADAGGKLCVVYQTEEKGYIARSFEDAFIHVNRKFIDDHIEDFRGLNKKKDFKDTSKDSFALAACVLKKTHFALDIIYHSDEKFSNWAIPAYISEGLLWLKK